MKGKITHYGIDSRDHLSSFLRKFYAKNAAGATEDSSMSPESLGKNLSCFVYKRDFRNFLVMFDGDDGSGGTPSDCKINWWKFRDVLDKNEINDYLIFKMQYASSSDQRQFYPFKMDVYPLAMMTNDPDRLVRLVDSLPAAKKDIDVLFVGGRVHEHNRPFCWPKNRDLNQWWPGNRKTGYEKLLEIKQRRIDLTIETHDGLVDTSRYYDLVNRSKICIDFPGIGLSSRKFYEFLIMGKCVIALKQNTCCWPLDEWYHYASLERDYGWTRLEETIDVLLKDERTRTEIEDHARSLRPFMTHENIGDYVANTVDAHITALLWGEDFDSVRPRYT